MLSRDVIKLAKEHMVLFKTKNEYYDFIYQLCSQCELSVLNISRCYTEFTPDNIANYLIKTHNIKLRKCKICNQWKLFNEFNGVRKKCKRCNYIQLEDVRKPPTDEILKLRKVFHSGDFEDDVLNMCEKQFCIDDIAQVLKVKIADIMDFLMENQLKHLILRRCCWCYKIKNISEFHNKSTFRLPTVSHCAQCDYEEKSENEDYKKYNVKYHKEMYHLNISHKLSKNFSNAIYRNLAKQKSNTHWEEFVDFTLDELKQHLESLFDDNMSWDNYGSYWHVDHIVPVAAFNYQSYLDESFKRCWSLQNLQPLEISLNVSKQDFISEEWGNVELAAQLL